MERIGSEELASSLESHRERFNALFFQARRESPSLDGRLFLEMVQRVMEPIFRSPLKLEEGRRDAFVDALYVALLELFRQGLIGTSSRMPKLEGMWIRLLQGTLDCTTKWPRESIGPLTNALCHLLTNKRCRLHEWIDSLERASPGIDTLQQLRDVGLVAAWLSGVAYYRRDAIEKLKELPPELASLVLPHASREMQVVSVVEKLSRDPWYPMGQDPSSGKSAREMRIVAEIGSFRGFEGEFLSPPKVWSHRGELYASDPWNHYVISADRYGATLLKVKKIDQPMVTQGAYRLSSDGTITGGKKVVRFEILANSSSSASTSNLLAVTLPCSHVVFLVAESGM